MCETKVLARKGAVLVSRCANCGTIYIWQNNLVLNFSDAQFVSFKKFVYEMDFAERSLPFPDGEERAVLRTPDNNISFAFTDDEWHDFKSALDEAGCMMEIYRLIE